MVKHQQINKARDSGWYGINSLPTAIACMCIFAWTLVQSSLSVSALHLFSSISLIAQAWSKNQHAKISTVAIFYLSIIMMMHTLKSNPFTATLVLSFIDLVQRETFSYAESSNSLALSIAANVLYLAMVAVVYLDCY